MRSLRPSVRISGIVLSILLCLPPCLGAAPIAKLIPALGWDIKSQGAFPVSLAADKSGNIWVGTEGNGVWKYDPAAKRWTQFTTKDGLGDDCVYALAVDGLNRVWAGHLNHGVTVYNGAKWQNYGLIDGPIGDRVFAIAISPVDGDVWIATDMGLARYSEKRQDWDYYTRASGLPSDQIQRIAFNDKGELLAVTQCNGAAIARPDDGYAKWRPVNAPEPAPGVESADLFIRARLDLQNEPPLLAGYGATNGGLLTASDARPFTPAGGGGANTAPAPMPAPAPAPMLDEAKGLAAALGKLTANIAPGEAFYLADDWRTEGDWIGRYGNGCVKLCGMAQNGDQNYPLEAGYEISVLLGPRQGAGDAGAVSRHEDETSVDLHSLYDPSLGHRRDAEDTDAGGGIEARSSGDSNLWVNATVPDGVQCLSFYFEDNDAHTAGAGGGRAYDVTLFSDLNNDGKIQTGAPLSRTRVLDFWGGVYKQFMVRGPAHYAARIGGGPGARLQGVFLDQVTGVPPENQPQLPGFEAAPYTMPEAPDNIQPTPLADAALNLWAQLDDGLGLRGAINLQMPFRIWCYRAAFTGQAPPEILEDWRWQVGIWTPDDRKKYDDAMKAARDAVMQGANR